jgi:hypothetical protein
MRVEHEYERAGALAYLAAWDVHRAVLMGRTEPTTGIAPFGRLVQAVVSREPYRSARTSSRPRAGKVPRRLRAPALRTFLRRRIS